MKKQIKLLSVIAAATGLCLSLSVNAQTLYVPSGTGGIGSTSGSPNTNIGFGTSTPSNYLAGTNGLTLFGTYPGLAFATSTKTWLLYRQTDNSFRLWENSGVNVGDDRITVLPGGNLGVGVTNPSQILHVAKDGGTGGTQLLVQDLSTTYPGGIYVGSYQGNAYLQPSAAGKSIIFWDNTAERMRILSGGNVGINNPSPLAKLQVTNGSVLFDGTTGTTPVSGAGTRMMWVPAKGAFRAGAAGAANWDDGSIGQYSFAAGQNTTASGINSFAAGISTNASGGISTAFGDGTTASGVYSTTFGTGTTASAYNSTAFGSGSIASGNYSTAFGSGTVAQAWGSFVLGVFNWNPGTYTTNAWIGTDPLFVIGNGNGPNARSNAVTILKNGTTGIANAYPNSSFKLDVGGAVNATQYFANGVALSPSAQWQISGNNIYYNSGNVAIGTTPDANYKLVVCGPIRTQRVVVESFTCDFVFDKKYPLPSLKERRSKVLQDRHLLNVASANEMDEKGNDLGNTMMGILQNVEEHELYLYKHDEVLSAHDEKLKSLEQENAQLKEQLSLQQGILDQQGKAIDELKKQMKSK